MLVEARLSYLHALSSSALGIGEVRWVVGLQLPLSRDTSPVACFLHQVTESFFRRIENAEVAPITVVVFSRHDLDSGRSTKRLE